jgi:hypothetical protein
VKNPLVHDRRPVAPPSADQQLAAIAASLVRIEGKVDRLLGIAPAAGAADPDRAERHEALARKLASEGNE